MATGKGQKAPQGGADGKKKGPMAVLGGLVAKGVAVGAVVALFSMGGQKSPKGELIVKKGDSLYKIAEKYNTTVPDLVKLNKISNKEMIFPGDKIILSEAA
eukprot:CAMPEP_0197847634 /NCGR_PEP_ID=MMETSP1438-20131217/6656_1 /TAXON_ID=1461541 /ORGANISM="Pterosperma sp., Strain CCMP1384" /LENGTH=100 /DNA_ID=CAMNT_0043459607 /DNA_START=104 /DNA_END=406 /DNA_ORIENTATION=+